MILEALFLTALVMSSFYMCELVNEPHGTSECVHGFHQTYEEYKACEDGPPEVGPDEDPSIETIFTITLSSDEDGQNLAVEDGWTGPRSFEFDGSADIEEEDSLVRSGKGPMRLHFRVPWRENPLFNDSS